MFVIFMPTGTALRGDGTECDSNFQQLLRLKGSDDSNLADWLNRKENVYTSPDIQNEIIKVLGNHVQLMNYKVLHF